MIQVRFTVLPADLAAANPKGRTTFPQLVALQAALAAEASEQGVRAYKDIMPLFRPGLGGEK